jgi:hypothetical protein
LAGGKRKAKAYSAALQQGSCCHQLLALQEEL